MCGRLNVIDDPGVRALCDQLGIALWPEHGQVFSRFIRAAQPVSVVRQREGVRCMQNALWWLLLEPTQEGFKPSRFTSFNTRYDKLNVTRSAGFHAYRHSRCIIPVKGFGETEYCNGKPLHYHDLEAEPGHALALGGLCREWVHHGSGQRVLSCSVITLPPHPRLAAIHGKSMPMILPQHDDTLSMWLYEEVTTTQVFEDLLRPHLPQKLIATPIDKPASYQPLASPFVIEADSD
ncbi:SOS response-associated peptidase family protein [Lacimicrobium sp. SS2-24]|uniref:SOS response-associated peptidase family protein n=1 Tax=Lacimicrobium sp. SS2-24 TaxID=2005569 RepID=UPI000B4B53B9|nr:SOS response-associated peptidase family protein [Lacimicrobium sp. SS2-24]